MADPHNGGDNIDQQRNKEDRGACSNNENRSAREKRTETGAAGDKIFMAKTKGKAETRNPDEDF